MLGRNIRYLRKAKDMSQDKLAELLGYKSFTTIQKWESGVAEPPFKTLVRLSELFRVDMDDLVNLDLSNYQSRSSSLSPLQVQLLSLFEELNDAGQQRVIDYAADLVAGGRYQKNQGEIDISESV